MYIITIDSQNNPMKPVGIVIHFKDENIKFQMQKLLVRVTQAVKKVARTQVQRLSSKANSSPSPSASKSFEGRAWIKGYSRAMRQDQKCHGKSAELNDSHGLAWLSQFPGASIDSVSWKACGCHILSFSKEV